MTAQAFDVQLKGVKKWYGPVAAVKGIDLAIPRGEMVCFLGPSGCGKTTTLRMIAGLEDPDEGEIIIRGTTMNDIPTYRRNIGMVFQNYALFPHMTVYDNIAFGLAMRKASRSEIAAKVKEVMALVRLETMADRLPSQLSGGQRQRVALARALVTKPNVLLLDEPLGALDKKLREQMQVEIRMLQREVGITAIFVTHDQEEALTLSDRIVVMNGGSIVQMGTPQEIYRRPATPFVSDFIGVSNAIDAVAGERMNDSLEVSLRDSGIRVRTAAGENARTGQAVEISVRPENIVLGDPGAEGYNVLQGTVSHVVYTGALTYFHLDAGPGAKFIALAPNTEESATSQPQVGDRITFGWRYESTRLLAKDA
jgi:spermidine/putrescine ABC transporter ATP-binding subunit